MYHLEARVNLSRKCGVRKNTARENEIGCTVTYLPLGIIRKNVDMGPRYWSLGARLEDYHRLTLILLPQLMIYPKQDSEWSTIVTRYLLLTLSVTRLSYPCDKRNNQLLHVNATVSLLRDIIVIVYLRNLENIIKVYVTSFRTRYSNYNNTEGNWLWDYRDTYQDTYITYYISIHSFA